MAEQIAESSIEPLETGFVPRIQDYEWTMRVACDSENGDELLPKMHNGAPTSEEKDAISRFCASCIVREECLIDALKTDFRAGIRGGMTESQRREVHDQYEKSSGVFDATDWEGYVNTALVIKENFTYGQRESLKKKRQNQAKIVDLLTGEPDGKMFAEDAQDLRNKFSEMTGLRPAIVANYLGELEQAGKIERLFRLIPGKKGRGNLIGVQLSLDAA